MGISQGRSSDKERKEGTVYLKQKITLLRAISLTIGTIIGSGIFISPKGVLQNSGNIGSSLIIWLACGVLSMFGALSYADLGTSIKKSGGHYIYLLETLGTLPAFLRLWAEFFMIRPGSITVLSLTFGRYLIEPLFDPCHTPIFVVKLISAIGVCLIIALNCCSVRWAANIQTALTALKVVTITLIIVPGMVALVAGHNENFQNAFDSSSFTVDKLPLAFYSGMYACSGWFVINFVTEEIINPERVVFAASREGHWPQLFSMIHIRRHTPLPALILMMPMVFLMISIGDLYGLLNLYSFSHWLSVGMATLGLIVHRFRHPELPRPFKVPIFIPMVFTVVCLFAVGMSLYSDPVNTGIGCAITLSGVPVYYLTIYKPRAPGRCMTVFNFLTLKLQVLMEVIPQEKKTY